MAKLEVTDELLERFKKSIGDLNLEDDTMDDYYTNFLEMAQSDLVSDDISVVQLKSTLGMALTVLYAKALMNDENIASNQTITLLRNKLSLMTKGDRVNVQQ